MSGRSRGERAGLSRAQVLDAAMSVADADGLDALSMRRVAAVLGVQAMTLYHYFPSKAALLDGLVERLLEGSRGFLVPGNAWDRALHDYAVELRVTLMRHPRIVGLALTRPLSTKDALAGIERGLRILADAGFSVGRALDVLNVVTIFVIGHTIAEVQIPADADSIATGSVGSLARLDPHEFPLVSEAARSGQGTDDDERFRFGLAALLAGLAESAR